MRIYAQSVREVRLIQDQEQIIVLYDLLPGKQGERYEVTLYYSYDGGKSFRGQARMVSGAIGKVKPGEDRQIHWQIRKELGSVQIEQFLVEIRVKNLSLSFDYEPKMVLLEGGAFFMGSNSGDSDELPIHTVQVASFELAKYEVTQREYVAITGNNPSHFKCEDCPVENVSWIDAQNYIQLLNQKTGKNYRLPTEAEWEFAARGITRSKGYTYAGGNDPKEVAWYTSNSESTTHPVGQKKANELGLYDMSGNVWEWCQDGWNGNYEGAPTDGSSWESGDSSQRVLRGGSWYNFPADLRVSVRYHYDPGSRVIRVGFRLARTL